MVSPSRGLSLRFPRFVRIKEDKTVEMASSPEFLASMYQAQIGKGESRAGKDEGELLDVDIEGELSDYFEN
jgi:DNA ligase 1